MQGQHVLASSHGGLQIILRAFDIELLGVLG